MLERISGFDEAAAQAHTETTHEPGRDASEQRAIPANEKADNPVAEPSGAIQTPDATEPAETAATHEREDVVESSRSSVSTESDEAKTVLSTDPMEVQIMREAVAHLGEMEVVNSLADLEKADEKKPEEKSQTHHAVESNEPLSFGDWLMKRSEVGRKAASATERSLINKFIQESPQISPVKAQFFSPSQMGKMSLVDDETFVTETLASIYARQGDFKKAARAYKNLCLKFPEKSSYFAALQKKAEDQIK